MTKTLEKKSEFEYKPIPHNIYHKYQCLAIRVITRIAHQYHMEPNNITYNSVLNYFKYNFPYSHLRLFVPDNEIISISKTNGAQSIIQTFNHKTYKNGINIKADLITNVDDSVLDVLSGFTIFSDLDPFINVCYSSQLVWPRIAFTLLHEYGHIYCYKTVPNYPDRYIYIQKHKEDSNFKEEYDQFEAETSAFASLLYAPDGSLGHHLLTKSFRQLQAIYNMSTPAMFNRLRNYFEHNCQATQKEATIYATWFRDGYTEEIRRIRKEIICTRPRLVYDHFTF